MTWWRDTVDARIGMLPYLILVFFTLFLSILVQGARREVMRQARRGIVADHSRLLAFGDELKRLDDLVLPSTPLLATFPNLMRTEDISCASSLRVAGLNKLAVVGPGKLH